MFCPECGTLIKKGYFTCDNCRFKIKLTREINREKDKKEIDDAKAKKIIEEKPKLVEKKKEVEEKTAVKDNKIPKPKKVKKDSEIKSENIEKSIIPGALDKKENNDTQAKKIEESEASPVQENRKMKRNLKKKIGLLYERLIDNSFQEKT